MGFRALLVVVLLGGGAVAHADPKSPWSEGVTDEQKAKAKTLLDAGNAKFVEHDYGAALESYTAAVAVWDHPAIRFNMVRCLVQLGRNLEAAENLDKALQYGSAPLEAAIYDEAVGYQKLLASQISTVTVSCEQAGVSITLDGKPFATCPGKSSQRVLAGQHQIAGKGAGLLTKTVELVAVGGAPREVSVKLDPPERAATIVHRWPAWLPWTVFGGGLALVGGGALASALGQSEMQSYDKFVDDRCTGNCKPGQLSDVQYLKDGAELKGHIGTALFIGGGVAVATGAVMLYLNRGRTVYPEVVPTAGGAALSWSGRF
ncbi:MAG: tetratricopeptide repeat protein [Deltaproteobacteria bacterium]|nr:tetratricopeptide repeat protein [Deltaproteobacteria bacterium]